MTERTYNNNPTAIKDCDVLPITLIGWLIKPPLLTDPVLEKEKER